MAALTHSFLYLIVALSCSSISPITAARHLLDTAAPPPVVPVPTIPTLPKVTVPPLPAMPSLPQATLPPVRSLPTIPNLPIPTTIPPLPSTQIPSIPKTTLPPMPTLPTIPTIPKILEPVFAGFLASLVIHICFNFLLVWLVLASILLGFELQSHIFH
ncbi:protein PELPK1-like [Macadamia integrifolia]|uniref:protein PELPK1-like n=1 Tax=Macadamia integrifolia TaxID=60698 RepID=UPI001C4F8A54|nr:protein PELPK1-like [Macadamia integrifolia]